jgi:pyruvate,water dikinase
LTTTSVSVAGGKGAKLGEMLRSGLPVPPGFVVTADAFRSFLQYGQSLDTIVHRTGDLDVHDHAALEQTAEMLRQVIYSSQLPAALVSRLQGAYQRLGMNVPVAVRSSAVSEDGNAASFAGQQETYLNVRGIEAVIQCVQDCWASFFSPRALFYRAEKGSLEDVEIAVVVQQMVNAEKSGVMFTVDPVQRRQDRMLIEAGFGLGEAVVSGMITPDQYLIDKADGSLVDENIAMQRIALVYGANGGTQKIELSEEEGSQRVLSDADLRQLVEMGLHLEAHFGNPQDVEWSIEGGQVYLLQTRPITTL